MNFSADARQLASAVSWAARRVPSKPNPPILAGMLVEAYERIDRVSFSGFDSDVSTQAVITVNEMETPIHAVVSGRLLDSIVKSLPAKPVTVTADDREMALEWPGGRATLPLMPAEDYPQLPTSPDPIGTVDAATFAEQIARVMGACDITGSISKVPELMGVHVAFHDDALVVTATNRYQMAQIAVSGFSPNITPAERAYGPILVPGVVMADVLRIAEDGGMLAIGVEENAVSFATDTRTTVARLLEVGGFPIKQVAQRMPKRSDSPTVVDAAEVLDGLKRASMVLEDKEAVHLTFSADGLTMVAGSGTRGAITADLGCEHTGEIVSIAVNPSFFASAITAAGATAELTISGSFLPILVTAPKDDAFREMLMPIRATA